MNERDLSAEWTRTLAPRTGDVRTELVGEAAEFLGISLDEARRRHKGAGDRFREEWQRTVSDPTDEGVLRRFYNQSDTELFELIEWHASDPIHYRTLILRDFALRQRPARSEVEGRGRSYLDYGSGIGNDAVVFGEAGFEVTLADISDVLLAFAAWRCRRRGIAVHTIDLKKHTPPENAFDMAACFDVLEHIPRPIDVVRSLHAALRDRGVLAVHAPFADDPEHPMHVVHHDVVTPRMRSLGFQPVDCPFPPFVRAPQVYEKRATPALDRAAYYIYDHYLNNTFGARLAALYRRSLKREPGSAVTQP